MGKGLKRNVGETLGPKETGKPVKGKKISRWPLRIKGFKRKFQIGNCSYGGLYPMKITVNKVQRLEQIGNLILYQK